MPLLQSALMWSRSAILGGWFGFAPGVDPCPNDLAPYDRRRPTLAYPDTPVDPVLPGLQVLHVMLKRSSRAAGSTQKPLMISAAQPCMHTAVALTLVQSVIAAAAGARGRAYDERRGRCPSDTSSQHGESYLVFHWRGQTFAHFDQVGERGFIHRSPSKPPNWR